MSDKEKQEIARIVSGRSIDRDSFKKLVKDPDALRELEMGMLLKELFVEPLPADETPQVELLPSANWPSSKVILLLAASVLFLLGGVASYFLFARRGSLADAPILAGVPAYEFRDPRIFPVRGQDTIGLELAINPRDVKEVRIIYDAPGLVGQPKLSQAIYQSPGKPEQSSKLVPVPWTSPTLHSQVGPIPFSPTLEIEPFAESRDRFRNVDPDGVVRFKRDLVVTPAGVLEKIDQVGALIDELGLRDPVRALDPDVFRLAGKDRMAFDLDVNLAYVEEVVVHWGIEKPGEADTRIASGSERALKEWKLKRLTAVSPPLNSGGGFKTVTAVLTVKYFPEARAKLKDLLPKEPHEFKRQFLLTPFGPTTDPGRLPRASLERIDYARDAKLKNLYSVGGTAFRQGDAAPEGFLMIAPVLQTGIVLGSSFPLSANGFFETRCYLGNQELDKQRYRLFIVVPTRTDATPIREGEMYPENYDWERHGYLQSDVRVVRNDGGSKFEK